MRNRPSINGESNSQIVHCRGSGALQQNDLSDDHVKGESHDSRPGRSQKQSPSNSYFTMPELPTDTPHPLRRKLSFAIPAMVFLALAAVEPIEMGVFADTLASFISEPSMTQDAPVFGTPTECINPYDSEAT